MPKSPAASGWNWACRDWPTNVTGRLEGRLIGLGVTGSIAAYKAVELLRLLRAEGADVAAMLTAGGDVLRRAADVRRRCRDTPSRPTCSSCFRTAGSGTSSSPTPPTRSSSPPATAHWLAAMAHGLAGDVVTATALATSRTGRRRAGDGRRHVDPSGDAGQRGAAAR